LKFKFYWITLSGIIAAIVFGYALTGQAQQANQTVMAKGIATVFAEDKALARDQAINDALRKAVEQTLGTFVQASTLVQNNMVVEDNILACLMAMFVLIESLAKAWLMHQLLKRTSKL